MKENFAVLARRLAGAAMFCAGMTAIAAMAAGARTPPAAPQFKDYPAEAPYTGPKHPLAMDSVFARSYRTRLRDAIATGKPEFAGRYIVARWGCGSGGCNVGAVIDAATGHATPMPATLSNVFPLAPEFAQEDGQALIYKLSSRLMVLAGDLNSGNSSGNDMVEFYELRDGKFRFIRSLPYGHGYLAKP